MSRAATNPTCGSGSKATRRSWSGSWRTHRRSLAARLQEAVDASSPSEGSGPDKVFLAHYEPRLRDNEQRAVDGRPLRGRRPVPNLIGNELAEPKATPTTNQPHAPGPSGWRAGLRPLLGEDLPRCGETQATRGTLTSRDERFRHSSIGQPHERTEATRSRVAPSLSSPRLSAGRPLPYQRRYEPCTRRSRASRRSSDA